MRASVVPVSEPWWNKNNPPNMKEVNSVQELVDALVRVSLCTAIRAGKGGLAASELHTCLTKFSCTGRGW